jgi:hypothetical protein
MLILVLLLIWLAFTIADQLTYTPRIEQRQNPKFRPFYDNYPFLYIDPRCSETQVSILKTAWDESKLLALAQTGNVPGYDYGTTRRMWLGDQWDRIKDPDRVVRRWAKAIIRNFVNIDDLYNAEVADNQYIYWWCRLHTSQKSRRRLLVLDKKQRRKKDSQHHFLSRVL